MTGIRRGALKGVLVGFLVGLVFPVLAWIVAGGGSAVVIRQDQPVTWLVDAVPFCLAVIGGFLGAGYARGDRSIRRLAGEILCSPLP